MKKRIIIIGLILFISSLVVVTKWSEIKYYFKSDNTNALLLNKNIFFDKLSIKDSVAFKFKILNSGNNVLKIKQIVPSCGCSIVKYDKKDIAENDTLIVNVIFKPEKTGKVKKDIILDLNTTPPFHVLSFNGEVVK